MTIANDQNKKIETRKENAKHSPKYGRSSCFDSKPISRDEIRSALDRVYTTESRPVNVSSIRNRTGFALGAIIIGAIIISGMMGIKYLELEQNLMTLGILLIAIFIPLGFLLSTKYIRKIYNSMSKFKDSHIPSYRTVLPNSRFQTQGLVYATLLCLILLGAQSVNFVILNNNPQTSTNDIIIDDQASSHERMPFLKDVTIGEAYESAGQYYRKIIVELNKTQNFNSKEVILEIQSWFAGKQYDKLNMTLEEVSDDILIIPIKVHEPDDTTIKTFLIHRHQQQDKILDKIVELSENNIYITKAKGKVFTNPGLLPKTIEVSVTIYNEFPKREPGVVSVIVSSPSVFGSVYRDSSKNNETIGSGGSWTAIVNFDILDDESIFEVELKIDETTEDMAEVHSL